MGKAKHPHDSKRPERANVIDAIEHGDIEALLRALSVRQKRFAEEYVIDFNGAAAVIRAGYSRNYADRQAHLLLKHKGVSAYIDHLTQSMASKITAVDPDYVIQRTVGIIDKDAATDGNRLRGLELIARILGMLKDRTELSGPDGGPIETKRIEEEARDFTNLLRQVQDRQTKKEVTLV